MKRKIHNPAYLEWKDAVRFFREKLSGSMSRPQSDSFLRYPGESKYKCEYPDTGRIRKGKYTEKWMENACHMWMDSLYKGLEEIFAAVPHERLHCDNSDDPDTASLAFHPWSSQNVKTPRNRPICSCVPKAGYAGAP